MEMDGKRPMAGEKAEGKRREPSMDLLRLLAFIFVVGVHSYLNGEFYYQGIKRPVMLIPLILRVLLMCCVPLFLMLSGYLNQHKKPHRRYYFGLLRVVFVYLASSLACVLFECVYYGESFSFWDFFWRTLAFEAAPYSWYIQMYLGFALLFPFLNVCWEALETQKKRLALVAVFVILTALPSLLNTYCFTVEGWWIRPSVSDAYDPIVPQWWQSLYPFTYYFLGAYVRSHPPKARPWLYLLATLSGMGVFGLYNYYRSWGDVFVWDSFSDYPGYQCLAVSCFFFLFFVSLSTKRWPTWLCRALAFLSDLTLGAYLLSWIPDEWIYPLLCNHYPRILDRLVYLPLCVVISVGISLALSLPVHLLWLWIKHAAKRFGARE